MKHFYLLLVSVAEGIHSPLPIKIFILALATNTYIGRYSVCKDAKDQLVWTIGTCFACWWSSGETESPVTAEITGLEAFLEKYSSLFVNPSLSI